jgi:hypothetical protein
LALAIVAQSDDEIRGILARVVAARWPDEALIFTTECGREVLGAMEPPAHQPGSLGGIVAFPTRIDRGLVGATEQRLVYHGHSAAISSLRAASAALAAISMIVLISGGNLLAFYSVAFAAVVLWMGARVTDLYLASGAYLPYEDIRLIDDVGQQIEGLTRSGAPIRIRIPDQADFQMIVTLATGQDAANAA